MHFYMAVKAILFDSSGFPWNLHCALLYICQALVTVWPLEKLRNAVDQVFMKSSANTNEHELSRGICLCFETFLTLTHCSLPTQRASVATIGCASKIYRRALLHWKKHATCRVKAENGWLSSKCLKPFSKLSSAASVMLCSIISLNEWLLPLTHAPCCFPCRIMWSVPTKCLLFSPTAQSTAVKKKKKNVRESRASLSVKPFFLVSLRHPDDFPRCVW